MQMVCIWDDEITGGITTVFVECVVILYKVGVIVIIYQRRLGRGEKSGRGHLLFSLHYIVNSSRTYV